MNDRANTQETPAPTVVTEGRDGRVEKIAELAEVFTLCANVLAHVIGAIENNGYAEFFRISGRRRPHGDSHNVSDRQALQREASRQHELEARAKMIISHAIGVRGINDFDEHNLQVFRRLGTTFSHAASALYAQIGAAQTAGKLLNVLSIDSNKMIGMPAIVKFALACAGIPAELGQTDDYGRVQIHLKNTPAPPTTR